MSNCHPRASKPISLPVWSWGGGMGRMDLSQGGLNPSHHLLEGENGGNRSVLGGLKPISSLVGGRKWGN